MTPKYPHVRVRLVGGDGNVFTLIGTVGKQLGREVGPKAKKEFQQAAMGCESYDAVLSLIMATVEVE